MIERKRGFFTLFLFLVLPVAGWPLSILLPVEPEVAPLQLTTHEQWVDIEGQIARTTLHQVFHNPTPKTLEAIYLFPIPRGTQVTDFSMIINGDRVHGEVLEREKARQIYEDIVRRLRDPGLIEYMNDDLLRVRIFPIPPHGDQTIDLELVQVLPREGELTRYEFPFGSDPSQSGLPVDLGKASLALRIASGASLATVYSPTHGIRTDRKPDGHEVAVTVDPSDLQTGRDFVLYFGVAKEEVGVNLVAFRPYEDEAGYFMLLVSPRQVSDPDSLVPKDVTFVLDTSGSMSHNGKLDQAKEALVQCIGSLRDSDRFNIVFFSTDVDALSESFLPATPESRNRAERFLNGLLPRGGTNIEGALIRALQASPSSNDDSTTKGESRLHVVVFMTDGRPTVGETVPPVLLRTVEGRNTRGLRVFTFGLGYDVNTRLLDDIAAATNATADYVKPEESIERKVTTFFDKVSAPVLTHLELTIEGVDVSDLYPRQLPDLFQGQQVIVFGRYRGAGDAAVRLKGRMRDAEKEFVDETVFPQRQEANGFIAPLWATRRVGFLLDEIRRNGESEELRDEVVDLAKQFSIVTPYTSFLVTEDQGDAIPVVSGPRGMGRNEPRRDRIDLSFSTGQPMASPAPGAPAMAGTTLSQSSSGEQAVAESLALRDMKAKDVLSTAPENAPLQIRSVGDRTFVLRNEMWTDDAVDEASKLPTLRIRFGSEAYFELLRLRADLKPVLQMGDKVIVQLDKAILEIGSEGLTSLGDAERALLKP